MRLFEILTLIVAAVTLLSYVFPRKQAVIMIRTYFPIIGLGFILVHLILENARWQMGLLYGLIVVLLLISLLTLVRKGADGAGGPTSRVGKVLRWVLTVLGLLVVALAALMLWGFPVFQLPEPTGPYAVGTTYLQFVDDSRPETLTEDPDDTRAFAGRMWYPAEQPEDDDPLPYQEYQASLDLIVTGTAPEFAFSHLHLSSANSYLDVPIADDQPAYPVLVLSTGFLALNEDYQIIAEELASHGYVVLCLDNPYESQGVKQPDGSVIPYSEDHAAAYREHEDDIMPLWEDFWDDDTTDAERNAIALEILASETFMDTILRIRVADIQFAIDELERINAGEVESAFTGRIDLDRLGIVGHSMGGAVAGQTCLVDERFDACVNLDGFQWGDVVDGEILQPFMIMYSEPFEGGNDYLLDNRTNTTYVLTIENSTHMNFQDAAVIMPGTKLIGMSGSISAERAARIVNDYLLAFFGTYLNDEDAPLLAGESADYPEVLFEVHNP